MDIREADRRRRVAAMLADTLAPLIDAELSAAPAKVVERPVMVRADRELLKAVAAVVKALDGLDQAKFAGLREARARVWLERSVRTLKTAYQKVQPYE